MKINQWLTVGGITVGLWLGAGNVSAQLMDNASPAASVVAGAANPDLAQKRFMERIHAGLTLSDESQWSTIQPLVQKVMDAQRDLARAGSMSRMTNNRSPNGAAGARTGRNIFFGQPSPEAQALQQAIDANASDADLKAALATYHASQKAKQATLVEAQENLRQALNPHQEAQATLLRLLD